MTKLALVQPSRVNAWEPEFFLRIKNELSRQGPDSSFELVDQVEEADVVFYVDSNKSTRNLADYEKLLQWAADWNKFVFALSIEDKPLGVLPGIYTSLESNNFDPELHLSWPHLEAPNSNVESTPAGSAEQTAWLFTISGSCSHRMVSLIHI